jgi:dethiobiotin synthetase
LAECRRRGLNLAGYVLNRTEPEVGGHESGNAELIAAVTGRQLLGIVHHLPPALRDDDDRVADAVRDALGPDGLQALLG